MFSYRKLRFVHPRRRLGTPIWTQNAKTPIFLTVSIGFGNLHEILLEGGCRGGQGAAAERPRGGGLSGAAAVKSDQRPQEQPAGMSNTHHATWLAGSFTLLLHYFYIFTEGILCMCGMPQPLLQRKSLYTSLHDANPFIMQIPI